MPAPLVSVAVYRRTVHASVSRIWENVLDWEHLPWLHRTSFSKIDLVDSGAWGWRARVGLQPASAGREILLDLRVDRANGRYLSHTLEGAGKGTEIWTRLVPRDDANTEIEVEFLVPGVRPDRIEAAGAAFVALYTRLWDEDESMMVRRTALLDTPRGRRSAGAPAPEPLDLGPEAEVRARSPFVVDFGGDRFRIVAIDGELVAHATVCPHRLGPLGDGALEGASVRCPWHGYRFDVRSGACSEDPRLRLASAPRVRVDAVSRIVSLGSAT
jgi:nitrite reductase/ring-hydroxylating ferredoxin subunit